MSATNPFKAKDLIRKYGWEILPYLSNLGVNLLSDSQILFVDSGATNALDSDDTEHGHSFEKPLATLNFAISLCTAAQGDVILLAPGHAETIADTGTASGTTTDEVTVDVAGVSIIGVGSGALRPTFTLATATDATISVIAANVTIKNIKIISDLADVAAGITVSAAGDNLVVEDCILTDGAAAKELVIGIQLAAAADGCRIANNQFFTVPAGGCASAIKLVGESVRTVIENNTIQGDYSASCIDGTTAASTLVVIRNNDMVNVDATAGSCVDMHASTTGLCVRNTMMGGKSIADCFIAAAMVANYNYSTGAVSASGILAEPAADAD